MNKHWSKEQERGNLFVLTLCLWLYRALGYRLFLAVVGVIIFWYWLFSSAGKNSLAYLTQVHHFAKPSPFKTRPTRWHSYWHLYAFGQAMVDKIAGWSNKPITPTYFGHEHIQHLYGKGAVIMVSHFGNIELLRAIKSDHQQKVNVLVYTKHANAFNEFLRRINPNAGVRLIDVGSLGMGVSVMLQECLDQGQWVVVACDRVPVSSDRKTSVSFLGKPANFPQGAWHLAHLLQAPLVAVFCYRQGKNIEIHAHPLSENFRLPRKDKEVILAKHIQCYADILQGHCIRAPYQWFNFYQFWDN